MFISKILSLYRDENDILRTVIKLIHEEAVDEKWIVRKIEIIYEDGEPAQPLEYQHAWIIPPEWEFISEVWEYTRKHTTPPGCPYKHEGEVGIVK